MRDESPQELQRRTTVQASLREHLSSHGYQAIDTPLLEPTELFLRKSGGELATRMYTFTDPGGNKVSLRPEFTSSAIRYYLERAGAESLPLRLQYSGPVFRYDEAQGYKQFHQMGAEIIGGATPESDVEVLALAWEGLSLMRPPLLTCVVGHVGVLHLMLEEMGLSHRAQIFLIASLPRLKQDPEESQRVQEQAHSLGLMKSGENAGGSRPLVDDMEEGEAIALLQDLFHDSLSGLLGSRSMEEILTRFIQKLQRGDDPKKVERGISLFSRLASVKGEKEQALPQIRTILQEYGISPTVLTPLENVLAGFHQRCPSASLTVDIGLVRGIAYYTGMVFEILAPGPECPLILCGGGRYDGLVKALGGEEDVPTLGFAYTLETLLDLLPEKLEERHLTSSNPQRR
ncbi:MAG: HisS family protein [Chloroflexota bacterium]